MTYWDTESDLEKLIEQEAQEEEDSFMSRIEMEEMIKVRYSL